MKNLLFFSLFAVHLSSCTPKKFEVACPGPACKTISTEESVVSGPASFTMTGAISGTVSGKKVLCSTIEQTPLELSQTLTAGGSFTLTFNKTGQVPIRCILANSDNSFVSDVVFKESLTRSIKGDTLLKSLISVRKTDTTSMSLGLITFNGQTAEVSASAVTQNGVADLTGSWSDLSGVWSHVTNLSLTTFTNNFTNTVSAARWHQASATDDLGSSHTGISIWNYDEASSPTDNLAGCQNKEGYALQAGWAATVNASAFQNFSDATVSFATLASSTATAAYADSLYGSQNICGISVSGQNCDAVDFSSGDSMQKGGLNNNQCLLLCIIKSMDALGHFRHPSFTDCPFEYKTNLSGTFATQLPATGTCSAANGSPCPGLIDRPERVIGRGFFEEARVITDAASFSVSRTDTVRSCEVDVSPPNVPDNDFSDTGECYSCGYDEKISIVVRRLSANQAYVSQRISRFPLATNDPIKCDQGGDSSFSHRAGVAGLLNVNDWSLTGNDFSQAYLMSKQ